MERNPHVNQTKALVKNRRQKSSAVISKVAVQKAVSRPKNTLRELLLSKPEMSNGHSDPARHPGRISDTLTFTICLYGYSALIVHCAKFTWLFFLQTRYHTTQIA